MKKRDPWLLWEKAILHPPQPFTPGSLETLWHTRATPGAFTRGGTNVWVVLPLPSTQLPRTEAPPPPGLRSVSTETRVPWPSGNRGRVLPGGPGSSQEPCWSGRHAKPCHPKPALPARQRRHRTCCTCMSFLRRAVLALQTAPRPCWHSEQPGDRRAPRAHDHSLPLVSRRREASKG